MNKMIPSTLHFFCCVIFFMLFAEAKSSTINSNGTGGGNWSAITTWSGAIVPTTSSDVVIQNGDNVTIDASTNNLNSITISTGGTLTLNQNGKTVTVTSSGTKLITVNGVLTLSSVVTTAAQLKCTNLNIANGGVMNNNSGAAASPVLSITSFSVASGGTLNHNAIGSGSAGSVNDLFGGATTTSLGATSLVNITNWGVTAQTPPALPTPSLPGYGNLTFSVSTVWGGSLQESAGITNIQGNFNIQGTGGNEFRLGTSSGSNYTVTIGGDLSISSGTLSLVGSSSSGSTSATINANANVNISGTGAIDMNSSKAAGACIFNIAGNFNGSGSGIIQQSKAASGAINLSGNLTLNGTSALNVAANANLNLKGTANQLITGNGNTFSVNNFNDTLKTTGTVTLASNTPITLNNSLFFINTGAANQFSDGGNTITGANNFNLGGNAAGYNFTGTILCIGSSGTQKFQYANSGPNTGLAIVAALNNVTLANTGTGKVSFLSTTSAATVTINGNLIISTGTLVTFMTVAATSGNHTFIINGNYTNSTTVSATKNATLIFNGSGAQTINSSATGGEIFPNLIINNPTSVSLASAITVTTNTSIVTSGNLTLSTGTLNCSSNQITGNATGTFSMSAGTLLLLGSTGSATAVSFPTNFTSPHISLSNSSTVTYQSNAAQTISSAPASYGNLTLSTGASATTKTLAGAITVNGNLSINASTTLDASASNYAINVLGNWVNNGTLTARNGTVTFNGTAAQSIGGTSNTSFYNINTTNSSANVTLAIAETVSNNLSITTGTLDCSTNQITGNATGTFTMGSATFLLVGSTASSTLVNFPTNFTSGNITLASSSTVSYQVAGTQTVSGAPAAYGNLSINGSGIKTLAAATAVNGDLSILAGTLDCSTNQITGNATGALTMSSGTSLLLGSTGSATAVLFPTNYTTAHTTLNAASTVSYQVGGAQTVSNVPQYGNFMVLGSGTKTLAGATTVKGNTTISSGILDCSTFQLTGLAGKNFILSAGTNLILGSTASAMAVSFPTNYLTAGISLDDASTVTYQSNANQTISATPATYGNLVLSSGASASTKTSAGILTIDANLTINSNTTLDVTSANNYGIYLNGNWINDGTFNSRAGTITLFGTSGQSIGGSSITDFYNLTSNNAAGVSLSSAQNLSGTLLLNAGVFTTNAQVFTLLTTLNGSTYTTGNIGIIDPSADIIGNITVQQYAARGGYPGWALLGTPVSSVLTFADWNDNFSITCATCPNGCCPGGQAFTSIDYYDETQAGTYDTTLKYVAIQNITDTIKPTKGYWVYMGNGTTNAILFDVTGTVAKAQTTPVTIPITYTDHGSLTDDGWNLISNPLPSPISWTALLGSTTNIDNAIYVYNQSLNSGVGAFAQYVAGVSSPAVGSGGLGDTIAMCQAFYVHSTGATALTALETNKVSANPSFLRLNNNASVDTYKPVARLFLDNSTQHDEAAFYFEPTATIHFEKTFDAYKMLNDPTQPYIASMSDAFMCSINGLPSKQNVSVPVKAICSTTGTFTITLGGNAPTGICINLFDSYTNITTNLLSSNYVCTLSDTTTAARFTLSFGTSSLAATTKIEQPLCTNPTAGLITAMGDNAGPWNYTWRDIHGTIIKTSPDKASADSLTKLNGGSYIVEITTTGHCDYFTQTINITPIIVPVAQFITSSDTLYLPNSTENFSNASTNASTYSWDFGDSNGFSTVSNPTYMYQSAGIFSVQMIASSKTDCSDTVNHTVYVIDNTTGINSHQNSKLSLLTTGTDKYTLAFNLINAANVDVNLYTISGQSVYTNQLSGIKTTAVNLDLTNLPIGLYMLKIDLQEQGIKTFKLLKQ